MTDRVDSEDRLLEVAKRSLGLVEARGSVEAKATRLNRSTRAMDESLVELMVENIAAGYVVPPCYLMRPSHLPDNEKEQRVLALSKVDRDQQLKADMFEWAAINRRVCGQGAVTLRNAIVAVRLADMLLNEGDQNDETIYAYKRRIEDHITSTYQLDIREAPESAYDLGIWCEAKIGELNPVPAWLRDGNLAAPGLFVPPASKAKSKPSTTMRLTTMKIVKDDDDDE